MTHPMFALSLGFGAVILATQITHAQTQCDSRETVTTLLAERYGETRRAMGIAGTDAVMELYASDSTGSWTITVTLPDGQMCLMASGLGFEALREELPAKGERI
jgi:hypothetical protein